MKIQRCAFHQQNIKMSKQKTTCHSEATSRCRHKYSDVVENQGYAGQHIYTCEGIPINQRY